MRVKTELTSLVAASFLALAAAAGSYFLIISSIRGIERERAVLAELSVGTKDFQASLVGLLAESVGISQRSFATSASAYRKKFDAVDGIKILAADAATKKAVDSVKALRALIDPDIQTATDTMSALVKSSVNLYLSSSQTLTRFYSAPLRKGVSEEDVTLAHNQVSTLNSIVQKLNQELSVVSKSIAKQDELIESVIQGIKARSLLVAAAIVAAIVALSLIVSLRRAASISDAIVAVGKALSAMAAGDLRMDLAGDSALKRALRSKNELGALSADLAELLASLNGAISGIKEASKENGTLGRGLSAAVAEATSSSTEIEASARSISAQMERMDLMVGSSRASVDSMSSGIAAFDRRIEAQLAMVESSAAALAQVTSSIDRIARIAEGDRGAALALVAESDRGRAVFVSAFDRVSEIAASVGDIREMASVIAGIASRTNLLAMNAAIEAAHAGDYGRGFAVVADEIRQLSVASSASSKSIAVKIREVTEKIGEAADTKQETSEAFDAISSKIREVSLSIAEIYSSVSQVQDGSKRIISAMSELQGQSTEVGSESKRLAGDAEAIRGTIEDLSRISREVVSSSGDIVQELAGIGSSVGGVSERANRIGGIGDELECLINHFMTEACDEPADPPEPAELAEA